MMIGVGILTELSTDARARYYSPPVPHRFAFFANVWALRAARVNGIVGRIDAVGWSVTSRCNQSDSACN